MKNQTIKRLGVILLIFSLLASAVSISVISTPVIVQAASKNSKYKIPGLPPANQTSYKLYSSYTTPISYCKKQKRDVITLGNDLAVIGTIIAVKLPTVGVTIGAVGGGIYMNGRLVETSLSRFKNNSDFVVKHYFKWKNKDKNNYWGYLKTEVYGTYKKKTKITKVKTYTELINFGDIE